MKHVNKNAGFSLIEVLVAMLILGIAVVPICQSIVSTVGVNVQSEALLETQMKVNSELERLMATGIDPTDDIEALGGEKYIKTSDPGVTIKVTEEKPTYYGVSASAKIDVDGIGNHKKVSDMTEEEKKQWEKAYDRFVTNYFKNNTSMSDGTDQASTVVVNTYIHKK